MIYLTGLFTTANPTYFGQFILEEVGDRASYCFCSAETKNAKTHAGHAIADCYQIGNQAFRVQAIYNFE